MLLLAEQIRDLTPQLSARSKPLRRSGFPSKERYSFHRVVSRLGEENCECRLSLISWLSAACSQDCCCGSEMRANRMEQLSLHRKRSASPSSNRGASPSMREQRPSISRPSTSAQKENH